MKLTVTAHAAVRYLERIRGVDLGPVRRLLQRNGQSSSDADVLAEIGTSAMRLAPLIATPDAEALAVPGVTRIKASGMVLIIHTGHGGMLIVASVFEGGNRSPHQRRPWMRKARRSDFAEAAE